MSGYAHKDAAPNTTYHFSTGRGVDVDTLADAASNPHRRAECVQVLSDAFAAAFQTEARFAAPVLEAFVDGLKPKNLVFGARTISTGDKTVKTEVISPGVIANTFGARIADMLAVAAGMNTRLHLDAAQTQRFTAVLEERRMAFAIPVTNGPILTPDMHIRA